MIRSLYHTLTGSNRHRAFASFPRIHSFIHSLRALLALLSLPASACICLQLRSSARPRNDRSYRMQQASRTCSIIMRSAAAGVRPPSLVDRESNDCSPALGGGSRRAARERAARAVAAAAAAAPARQRQRAASLRAYARDPTAKARTSRCTPSQALASPA